MKHSNGKSPIESDDFPNYKHSFSVADIFLVKPHWLRWFPRIFPYPSPFVKWCPHRCQRCPGLTLVVDSFHPEMAKTLQDAARHGDLRALEKTLSAPADPNQAAGIAGDGGVMVLWSFLKVWKGGKNDGKSPVNLYEWRFSSWKIMGNSLVGGQDIVFFNHTWDGQDD